MRVERAEQAGQSTTWLQLTLEDGTRLKAPAFSVAELGAFAGKELTDEELARLKAAASKARTKERAVRTVAASAVSERELQKRLLQKGASQEDAEETVEWLRELHLLSDADTAAQLVRSAAAKGYGEARIKNILYEKGIPKELWDAALDELPEMDGAIDKFLHQKLDGRTLDDKLVKKQPMRLCAAGIAGRTSGTGCVATVRGWIWRKWNESIDRHGQPRLRQKSGGRGTDAVSAPAGRI